MTLLSVNTTEHERPVYIGLTGLTWGLGTVLGPASADNISPFLPFKRDGTILISHVIQIIGGAFADSHVGWRFAFYINRELSTIIYPVESSIC